MQLGVGRLGQNHINAHDRVPSIVLEDRPHMLKIGESDRTVVIPPN